MLRQTVHRTARQALVLSSLVLFACSEQAPLAPPLPPEFDVADFTAPRLEGSAGCAAGRGDARDCPVKERGATIRLSRHREAGPAYEIS